MNRDYSIDVKDFSKAYEGLTNTTKSDLKILRHHNQKNGKTIPDEEDYDAEAKYHVIKSGDTLSGIAKKYRTSVKNLCRLNNINEKTILRIGRRLRVR